MKSKISFLRIISLFLVILIVILVNLKVKKENKEKEENEEINFESNETIKLYRTKKDEIEDINLNYYLLCVVASEIPFKYEIEAIKAQAIVARTYLYNKIENNLEEKGNVCDSYSHCQAFNDIEDLKVTWKNKGFSDEEINDGINKIKEAIVQTDGQVITYNQKIINAFFHASSPKKTEDASAIWGREDIPYLKSVESVEDEDYENRESEVSINYETFKNVLIDNGYIDDLSQYEFSNICINSNTSSGRVYDIKVGSCYIKAEDIRRLFNVKSTDFELKHENNNIVFHAYGYGHGVGMSQVGANTYAKRGLSYQEIIKHYYTGVEITNIKK